MQGHLAGDRVSGTTCAPGGEVSRCDCKEGSLPGTGSTHPPRPGTSASAATLSLWDVARNPRGACRITERPHWTRLQTGQECPGQFPSWRATGHSNKRICPPPPPAPTHLGSHDIPGPSEFCLSLAGHPGCPYSPSCALCEAPVKGHLHKEAFPDYPRQPGSDPGYRHQLPLVCVHGNSG